MGIGKLIAATLFGFIPLGVFAQQADSLTAHKLREVQITAIKPETFAAGSRQTIIDSAFLKTNNAGSLADILQNRTPIYIKTYGQGMLSTVSFRGTSASQTAVLWNGFNINLPSLGQTDFSLIPANSLSNVQIQHGSSGSSFGTSAIGGAVLLSSSSEIKPGLRIGAQQDIGSFGRLFSQLNGSYGFKKAGIDASVFHAEAQNDFTYRNTTKFGNPIENLQNAATKQSGFTVNASWQPGKHSQFWLRNWYTNSENQLQPIMNAANTKARNINRNLRSMAEWAYHSNWGNTSVKAAFFSDFMRYSDINVGNSDTDIKTYQAQAEHGFTIKEKLNLNLGADVQYYSGVVEGYAKPVSEVRNSFFALLRYDLLRNLNLNLNWRQGFVQGFNPPPSPTIGFNYSFLQKNKSNYALKGNVSRGYRVPTLNDRYYLPGNPNLKPESSWNYEAGLKHQFTGTNITAETEITAYALRVENWIQWVPTATSNLWSPQNLKKVNAEGLEFSGKITYRIANWKFNGGGNYAYTSSVQKASYIPNDEPVNNQLIYTPLHTGTAYLETNYKTWFFTLNGSYTGERFVDAENEKRLLAYTLFNIYGGKNLTFGSCQIQLIGRVNNLSNQVYQNLKYYAMPGRNYNLSLRFQKN